MKVGITNSHFNVMMLHLLFIIFWVNAEPLVETSQGILSGTFQQSRSRRIYSAFLGIPYGLPPIKHLRFANPVAAHNWTGIRAANVLRSICIQIDETNKTAGAEDCLYLNVYTPLLEFKSSSTNNTLLPVMVWIHGGGFTWGSGNAYGAKYLLDKDVILVTVNYRLGIFGFFCTGDSAAPGNFGLKDQVLALKWVQKHIKPFGGDSNRVTLCGHSVGAASVALHTISKASTGLFQKYILQSGPSIYPWAYQKRSKLIELTRAISPLLRCPWRTSKGLLSCMRRRSPESLLETISIFSTHLRLLSLTWTPTDELDSEDSFLTESPINLMEKNQIMDLPFISGVVTGEALVLTVGINSVDEVDALFFANLDSVIDFLGLNYDESLNLQKFRSAVKRFYFKNSLISVNKRLIFESLMRFISDGFFFHPQLAMLEMVTSKTKSPNYFYNLAYRGRISLYSNLANNTLDIGHGDDLIYLFNLSIYSTTISDLNLTDTQISVSKKMVDMWTSFAINDKPTSSRLSDSNIWLPYTTQNVDHLQIGNIDNDTDPTMTMSNQFFTDRMHFWQKILPIINS